MKAVLSAAGVGERLRPLTEHTPKCLIPIRGKALLTYWLDILQAAGVECLYLNGYHLADRVEEFLRENAPRYPFAIRFIREPHLTGTGGFLGKLRRELAGDEFFFFGHADNYCNLDLTDFIAFHRQRRSELSLALFRAENPSQCGIVEEMAPDGRILRFAEKPPAPRSNLASAALFLMSPAVFTDFPNHEIIDFSREVLPRRQGRMYGYELPGFNLDIGTPEQYRRAQELARRQL